MEEVAVCGGFFAFQRKCPQCQKWKKKRPGDKHLTCPSCRYSGKIEPTSAPLLQSERNVSSHAPLSKELKLAIVTLHKDGQAPNEIASKIPCRERAVNACITRFETKGTVESEKKSGRKRKTTLGMDEEIANVADELKFTTPRAILRETHLGISKTTVRRRLHEVGLFGRVAQKEFPLKQQTVQKRLSFGHGYAKWTEAEWDHVLFSDETHIELDNSGQVWCQRPVGCGNFSEFVSTKTAHPKRVSIWGCFAGGELGTIHIFRENLDSKLMKNILKTCMLPSALRLFPMQQWYFMQDNDPKHKSRLVQDFLFQSGITCIDLPPYSPDLNPIENLWSDLKRRIEKRTVGSIEELEVVIKEEWTGTTSDFLLKLSHSMSKRCKLIVENRGHKIDY
jgi:transposase